MGQKQNPIALRLGVNKTSSSAWFARGQDYIDNFMSDLRLRDYINHVYKAANIHDIIIKRFSDTVEVRIFCSRPGIIIGKKGADASRLKIQVENITQQSTTITVEEFKKADMSSKIVAESIAQQLERRVQFRKAMKRAVQNARRSGALGIKVIISGRLNGAEIARSESYHEGRVPLHTFRADIDYYSARAKTTYGIIGIKVWIFKDEILKK